MPRIATSTPLIAPKPAPVSIVRAATSGIGTQYTAHPDGYHQSSDLVASIKRNYPDMEISVSAYPEKHPESASLDADIDDEELEDSEPFEVGDLEVLSDLGLPAGVLGVILTETELYADEQLTRIAREMGFGAEFAAVLDAFDR